MEIAPLRPPFSGPSLIEHCQVRLDFLRLDIVITNPPEQQESHQHASCADLGLTNHNSRGGHDFVYVDLPSVPLIAKDPASQVQLHQAHDLR